MNHTHMFMGFLPPSKWTVWTDSSSGSTTSARSHLYSMVLPALSAATAWPCGTKCHVWARSHASSIRSTFTCEFVSHHAFTKRPVSWILVHVPCPRTEVVQLPPSQTTTSTLPVGGAEIESSRSPK